MTYEDTPNVTSSPEFQAGHSPCKSQAGKQRDLFGPEVVPANRIPQRAKEMVIATRETSGRTFIDSSASVALSALLASKLKTRLDTVGSMEYRQTWKEKVTPSGRVYWAHTASARRTSDKDCSGWPTPTKSDTTGGKQPEGDTRITPSKLKQIPSVLAGWPSPTAMSFNESHQPGNNRYMNKVAELTGWNRPRATDGTNGGPNQAGGALPADASLAGWATPATRDYRYPNDQSYQERGGSTKGEQLNNQVVHGGSTKSSLAETGKPAASVLNPAMSRWLQGFPSSYDQCSPGWDDWVWMQQQLREWHALLEETESAD